MELLNQIEQYKERIESINNDIKVYGDMLDKKKMDKIALEEMVSKLSKQIDEEVKEIHNDRMSTKVDIELYKTNNNKENGIQ